MYKYPVEIICGELQTQMVQKGEKMVLNAVRKMGVNVDKEELIKALQYDREQYEEGYEDGKKDVFGKVKTEIDTQDKWLAQAGYTAYNVDIAFNSIKRVLAESEVQEWTYGIMNT